MDDFQDTLESLLSLPRASECISIHLPCHDQHKDFDETSISSLTFPAKYGKLDYLSIEDEAHHLPEIPRPSQELQCEICGKKFMKSKQYYGHLRVHSKDKPWNCVLCPSESFKSQAALDKHKNSAHGVPLAQFCCPEPLCQRSFLLSSQLDYHRRNVHHKEKIHHCLLCGTGFFKKWDLRTHLKTHDETKKIPCKECGASFSHISNLNRHMRLHTGLKPFGCDQCGATFNQLVSLKKHKLKNTNCNRKADLNKQPQNSIEKFRNILSRQDSPVEPIKIHISDDNVSDLKDTDTNLNFDHLDTEGFTMDQKNEELLSDSMEKKDVENILASIISSDDCSPSTLIPQYGNYQLLPSAVDNREESYLCEDESIALNKPDDFISNITNVENILDEITINNALQLTESCNTMDLPQSCSTNAPLTYIPTVAEESEMKTPIDPLTDPQTSYNFVNFELLTTLSESQMDSMELFNVQELNGASFGMPEMSEGQQHTGNTDDTAKNIFFDSDLIKFLGEDTGDPILDPQAPLPSPDIDIQEESIIDSIIAEEPEIVSNEVPVIKKKGRPKKKHKKDISVLDRVLDSKKNIVPNNILNIKSIVSSENTVLEETNYVDSTFQRPVPLCQEEDGANDLIKMVEQDQVKLFATDDKDTFVISLNSDMDAERLEQLFSDGVLTIHVDDDDINIPDLCAAQENLMIEADTHLQLQDANLLDIPESIINDDNFSLMHEEFQSSFVPELNDLVIMDGDNMPWKDGYDLISNASSINDIVESREDQIIELEQFIKKSENPVDLLTQMDSIDHLMDETEGINRSECLGQREYINEPKFANQTSGYVEQGPCLDQDELVNQQKFMEQSQYMQTKFLEESKRASQQFVEQSIHIEQSKIFVNQMVARDQQEIVDVQDFTKQTPHVDNREYMQSDNANNQDVLENPVTLEESDYEDRPELNGQPDEGEFINVDFIFQSKPVEKLGDVDPKEKVDQGNPEPPEWPEQLLKQLEKTDEALTKPRAKRKKNVEDKQTYTCKYCHKVFTKKDNYYGHLAKHDAGFKRHTCTECGQSFAWRTTLARHESAKHGNKWNCPLCPAQYTTHSQVHLHLRRDHNKEKPHHCTYPDCHQTFFKKYDLTLHVRTHTDERPYSCSVCQASFRHASHCHRHKQTHFRPVPEHRYKLLRCK